MKITRKGWIRKLDKIVGDIVKARDVTCVVCGSSSNQTSGHLFSRVAYATRWDLDNVFCQCQSCNLKHEYDPYPFFKYATNLLGQDKIDELHFKYRHVCKMKDFQLEELYHKLEEELKSYE